MLRAARVVSSREDRPGGPASRVSKRPLAISTTGVSAGARGGRERVQNAKRCQLCVESGAVPAPVVCLCQKSNSGGSLRAGRERRWEHVGLRRPVAGCGWASASQRRYHTLFGPRVSGKQVVVQESSGWDAIVTKRGQCHGPLQTPPAGGQSFFFLPA